MYIRAGQLLWDFCSPAEPDPDKTNHTCHTAIHDIIIIIIIIIIINIIIIIPDFVGTRHGLIRDQER